MKTEINPVTGEKQRVAMNVDQAAGARAGVGPRDDEEDGPARPIRRTTRRRSTTSTSSFA
jgi:hypothetical protein